MDLVESLDLSEPDNTNILPVLVMLIQGDYQLGEKKLTNLDSQG